MEVIINNGAAGGVPTQVVQGYPAPVHHHHSHGFLPGVITVIVWVFLLVLLLKVLPRVARRACRKMGPRGWRRGTGVGPRPDFGRAEAILRERLARGEVSLEEYDKVKMRLDRA